ncbi:hypothetical protein [Clostridium beijerinckii]|uniref:Uncharacterized protein n=1 Tax=Clostridium beijerinckii TaxID=1520 RepID=A0AAW3WDC1_CLOBE|nr:hypothetical protein [Clostridium beijerinckii]MBC2459400.1 hypothetical protein [Clostridium beijerinckii]MBC2476904.1 hypothetical protein [Clostridium beijerinckii]NOV62734.1 hypothetical protein [Clostridium beijerinckii]NOV70304.1 hypothetical protein [Clostridium beijerinckii]NOW30788.1 hypothetical protein [Clostridium beijerinckii]
MSIEKLDLKEEIKNQRSAVHYIDLKEKEKFLKVIKEIEKEKVLQDNDMTISYMIEDDCISIAIYRSMDFMI